MQLNINCLSTIVEVYEKVYINKKQRKNLMKNKVSAVFWFYGYV